MISQSYQQIYLIDLGHAIRPEAIVESSRKRLLYVFTKLFYSLVLYK